MKQKHRGFVAKRIWRSLIIIVAVLAAILLVAQPVFATIANPDSTPTIESIHIWRNALVAGDRVVIIYENTPYATPPTTPSYTNAFIWRMFDTDNVTELGQALGYAFNDRGYGYNVIGFYFSAADNVTWGLNYSLVLSGTPTAFTVPPSYTYSITADAYSALTDTDEVRTDIGEKIIEIAIDLNNKWGLTSDYYLSSETSTKTKLSEYGQAFFRGALYGCQAYAPDIFPLSINNFTDIAPRVWMGVYTANLSTQHTGDYIGTGIAAGETALGVHYNLMGMLITLLVIAGVVVGGLVLSSDWWSSTVSAVPPLIIMTRMGMLGLGELGLIASVGWLFLTAKIWKLI